MKIVGLSLALLLCAGCVGPTVGTARSMSSIHPVTGTGEDGQVFTGPRPVQPTSLPVPARIALAFVPEANAKGSQAAMASWATGPLPETFKAKVLENLANAFRGESYVGNIECVPAFYLGGHTAPEFVASVRATFNVEAVALVTYDLQHFNRVNGWALTYIALVPALFVPGNELSSHLYLDTAVYWSENAALLFRAAGSASGDESFCPLYYDDNAQIQTERCFAAATTDLVPKLRKEFGEFAKRIKAESHAP
jgi:rhombotail lipoprotein